LSFQVFCLRIFFSPVFENLLRKEDREDISTLKEKQSSLRKARKLKSDLL